MPTQPVLLAVEPAQIGSRTLPTVSLFDIHAFLNTREAFKHWSNHHLRTLMLRRDHDYADGRLVSQTANHFRDIRMTISAARQLLAAIRGSRADQLNRDLLDYEEVMDLFSPVETGTALVPVTAQPAPTDDMPAEFHEIGVLCAATLVKIGGATVLGIPDARSLHAGLGVGRDYTNWIKDRIGKFGFVQGQDYEVAAGLSSPNPASAKSRAQVTSAYTITLDMAKHLAMVENNDIGRLVRRYFIWVEQRQHQAERVPAPATALDLEAAVAKLLADKIDALPQLIDAAIARDPRVAVREFKAPLQVLQEAHVPPKGRRALSIRVRNRLQKFCIATGRGNAIRLSQETGRSLFQVDVVKEWLGKEGGQLIADHKAKTMGQGIIPFAPKPL